MNPLEIKTSYGWRVGCLAALGLCFVLPFLASAVYTVVIGEPEKIVVPLVVALVALVVFSLPILVILGAKRDSVRRFDQWGVHCHNGRSFPWQDFQGVREVVSRGRGGSFINNYDLYFRTGKVPVYFRVAKNEADVMRAIGALQAGFIPWLPPRA